MKTAWHPGLMSQRNGGGEGEDDREGANERPEGDKGGERCGAVQAESEEKNATKRSKIKNS